MLAAAIVVVVVIAVVPEIRVHSCQRRAGVEFLHGLRLANVLHGVTHRIGAHRALGLKRHHAQSVGLARGLFACLRGVVVVNGNSVLRVLKRPDGRGTAATGAENGHLFEAEGEGAHELGATRGADGFVVPVGLVLDDDLEGEFVAVADAADADDEVLLEVAAVVGVADEFLHFEAEELDVFKGGVVGDVDFDDFLHGFGAGEVVDPGVVEDDVGDLGYLHALEIGEDGVEEGDLFHDEALVANSHAVLWFDVRTCQSIEHESCNGLPR